MIAAVVVGAVVRGERRPRGPYVKVLHRDFPGVKVAADAVLNPDPGTTRQRQWNSQLLGTAHLALADNTPSVDINGRGAPKRRPAVVIRRGGH